MKKFIRSKTQTQDTTCPFTMSYSQWIFPKGQHYPTCSQDTRSMGHWNLGMRSSRLFSFLEMFLFVRGFLELYKWNWYPGWCLDLHVLDDCTMHDASSICEILALTIEKVHRISIEKNRPMPSCLLLGSDNTVREAKNSILLLLLINLTSRFKFRTTGLLNLRKAHTHDVLDQCLDWIFDTFGDCNNFTLLPPNNPLYKTQSNVFVNTISQWSEAFWSTSTKSCCSRSFADSPGRLQHDDSGAQQASYEGVGGPQHRSQRPKARRCSCLERTLL